MDIGFFSRKGLRRDRHRIDKVDVERGDDLMPCHPLGVEAVRDRERLRLHGLLA
jgi:hypothetical protein